MKRPVGSHISDDGSAKVAYETYEQAAAVADLKWVRTGRPVNVYLCSQRPDHYHIGGGVRDLRGAT